MNKLIIAALIFCAINHIEAQSFELINQVNTASKALSNSLSTLPSEYLLVDFDQHEIIDKLKNAPKEFTPAKNHNITSIALPSLTGEPLAFQVQETKLMADGLAAKFPKIKTYSGTSQDGKAILKMAVTPLGITAFVSRPQGSYNIWPLFGSGTTFHALHRPDKSLPSDFVCGFEDTTEILRHIANNTYSSPRSSNEPVSLLIYDLAAACTGEFSQFFANPPTIEASLSGITSIMTVVNAVTELELGIRFRLIENNELLISLDPESDPYPDVTLELVENNTRIITDIIDPSAYDSGVLFAHECNVNGGVAYINGACYDIKKGGILNCTSLSNMDRYISVSVHEFGHHLGSHHTWNNCPGAEAHRSGYQSYEPGSGSTIMSYAGLCGNQNILTTNQDYFHASSIEFIGDFTRNNYGHNCAEEIITTNHRPSAKLNYSDGFYIPIGTPFELEGRAEDMDDDLLLYNWEQYDLGATVSLGNQCLSCPLFKSLQPAVSSKRTFPSLFGILNNAVDVTEVLPLVSRNLTFRFVVRDNHSEAGGIDWAEVSFNSTEFSGPFTVENLNIEQPYNLEEYIEVRWNVANTDNPLTVNSQYVNILLSKDGGTNFDTFLAQNVPNDGIEIVQLPKEIITKGRIRVEAADNIFFNVNESNFKTTRITDAGFSMAIDDSESILCLPSSSTLRIYTNQIGEYNEDVEFKLPTDIPSSISFNFTQNPIEVGQNTELNISALGTMEKQNFNIELHAISGNDTLRRTVYLTIFPDDFSSFVSLRPEDGMSNIKRSPTFKWSKHPSALYYGLEISKSPTFDPDKFIYRQSNIKVDSVSPKVLFDENELYYWRVFLQNECNNSTYSEIKSFHTIPIDCSIFDSEGEVFIDSDPINTVNIPFVSTTKDPIVDISIPYLKGLHNNVGDLHAFLESPQGVEVKLFGNDCVTQSNFDLSFDDDAFTELNCPLSVGNVHIPLEPFSVFDGMDALGNWNIRIEDRIEDNGGLVLSAGVKICRSLDVVDPIILTNKVLTMEKLSTDIINEQLLLVADENNSDEEITYTIVDNVKHGEISKNGNMLQIGEQFTQAEISSHMILYEHTTGDEFSDDFSFTVRDFDGGWIPITKFNIELSNITSNFKTNSKNRIKIYPNPTRGIIHVDLEATGNISAQIITLDGRPIYIKSDITSSVELNISNLMNGIYFIQLTSENWTHTEKIIKISK